MGNSLSYILDNSSRWMGLKLNQRWKRKRVESSSSLSDSDDEYDKTMHTPKRRKLMTTSQYIYKTLFQEGLNSDVTIMALGREWKLHKVYLCQSPYFSSMFGGSWREAEEGIISVGIEDPNITIDALRIVFGSFYQDEIVIEPVEVIPVVAAATLFQLGSLIQQCTEIVAETINIHTVLKYHEAALQYGLASVQEKTKGWLLRNLMSSVQDSTRHLQQINCSLMEELVASPDLVVMQTEFSVYILLKTWTFLQENIIWEGDPKECVLEAHKFFQSHSDRCFLDTTRGSQYLPTFKALRLQHLVNHHLDVELLEADHIVPIDWFYPVFKNQWYQMLRIDQGVDRGPKQLSDDEFNSQCLRCGRILLAEGQHIWRWTGFNFGLDIVVSYIGRSLRFKRNQHNGDPHHLHSASQPNKRHLMYKLTVFSQDEQGQQIYSTTSGLKNLSLGKKEEVKVLSLDREAKFPLFVSASFLVTTPLRFSKPGVDSGQSPAMS
ncbi:germ cell-less protein-like 1 isoform X1 [Limulus polyphemus]|uniref:Germ cell-less protein-like 1 isoform X1 n=2 Tax=Limulus polyphemus TaxID=6850 RepID=A0ABM1TJ35_LIMPO|nr:germ cell-less protein-like 1 isoform X1 [Limulus polyphemus]